MIQLIQSFNPYSHVQSVHGIFYHGVSLLVLFISLLADLPHNVVVSETGRGSGGEIHPLDVIVLVKRYAADRDMCQDHT